LGHLAKRISLVAMGCVVMASIIGCSSANPNPAASSTPVIAIDAKAREALPSKYLKSGLLKVAVDTTYPPNEFKESNGQPAGWEVELLSAMGSKLGLVINFKQVPFSTILPGVVNNIYDTGVASIFDTPERRLQVDMVDYYSAGTLWGRKSGSALVAPANACGKTIAVQGGTYQATVDLPARNQVCLEQGRAAIKIVSYKNQNDASDSVELGRVDAFVADSPVTLYAVKQSAGKLVAVGDTYGIFDYSLPIARGNALTEALRLALQSLIDDGTYRKILASWGVQNGAIPAAKINGGF
jgi:polar amino acid transport system substrate-binding protein